MKCLICYQSKTGTTAKCAEILKKKLEKRGAQVTAANLAAGRPQLAGYDCIITGAPVRMGKIPKETKAFLEASRNELLNCKKTAFFICSAFPAQTQQVLLENFPRELLEASVCAAGFGGEVDIHKQKGFDRFMARMMTNLVKHYKAAMPSVREENIEAFANTLCCCFDKEQN